MNDVQTTQPKISPAAIAVGAVLLVAFVVMVGVVVVQNRRIARMEQVVENTEKQKTSEGVQVEENEGNDVDAPVEEENVWIGPEYREELVTGTFRFREMCEGTVVPPIGGFDGERPFETCLGTSTLEVSKNGSDFEVFVEIVADTVDEAPVLSRVTVIPSMGEAHEILLAFSPQPCLFDEAYCGVGMPELYYSHLFDTVDEMSVKELMNAPDTGRFVWNGSGRAAFVYSQCGGAGCIEGPVRIYDVHADTVTVATTETAVAPQEWSVSRGGYPENAMGDSLAFWSDLVWSEENGFQWSVVRHDPDGTTETILFK